VLWHREESCNSESRVKNKVAWNVRYYLKKEIRNSLIIELGRRNSGYNQRQEEGL
jgi:hypothetical protein